MIGQEIDGYKVISEIAAGGMGVVYVVEHATLGRRAMKVQQHVKGVDSEEMRRRFENEVRAVKRIHHPALPEIYHHRVLPDGRQFIVMELLDGEDMFHWQQIHGRFDEATARRIGAEVADCLAAAHQEGVIHRDIKPSNIFLARNRPKGTGILIGNELRSVVVLDLGIARLPDARFTQHNLSMGTPGYIAPEQRHDARIADERSDVYSLGVVLHEMVTGSLPRVGRKVSAGSPSFTQLLNECIAQESSKRPSNMTELRKRLLSQPQMGGVTTVPPHSHGVTTVPSYRKGPTPPGGTAMIGRPAKRPIWWGGLIAILGTSAFFGSAIAWLLWKTNSNGTLPDLSPPDMTTLATLSPPAPPTPPDFAPMAKPVPDLTSAPAPDLTQPLLPIQEVRPLGAWASTTAHGCKLPGGYGNESCAANLVLDGDIGTAWCEGVSGSGRREFVELDFDASYEFTAIEIASGYHKSLKLWEENGSPIQLALEAGGSARLFHPSDRMGWKRETIDPPLIGKTLTIRLEHVRTGQRYDDTCISEVRVWGRRAR